MGYPNPFLSGIPSRDGSPDGPSRRRSLIGRFLEGYDNENTRRSYRADLRSFFSGEEAFPQDVREIGLPEVMGYLQTEAEEVGFGTLRRRASTLSGFFKWLAEEGLIEESPLVGAGGPRKLAKRAKNQAGALEKEKEPRGTREPENAAKDEEESAAKQEREGETPPEEAKDINGAEEAPPAEAPPTEEQRRGPVDGEPAEEQNDEVPSTYFLSPLVSGSDSEGGLSGSGLASKGSLSEDSPSEDSSLEDSSPKDGSPEEIFPKDFLRIPSWAKESLGVGPTRERRFGKGIFEEGTQVPLSRLPHAIVRGLALLGDRSRFPGGAVERPYYRLMGGSGEWMVTIWRTAEETAREGTASKETAGGEAPDEKRPRGLATRLTYAKPLMEAKERMEKEGTPPSPYGEAARILWLLHGRQWALTEPMYELLDATFGTPFGRIGPERGRGPTQRWWPAGSKEAREQVAVEIATLLSKGLGLSKSEKVQVDRVSF